MSDPLTSSTGSVGGGGYPNSIVTPQTKSASPSNQLGATKEFKDMTLKEKINTVALEFNKSGLTAYGETDGKIRGNELRHALKEFYDLDKMALAGNPELANLLNPSKLAGGLARASKDWGSHDIKEMIDLEKTDTGLLNAQIGGDKTKATTMAFTAHRILNLIHESQLASKPIL